MLRPPARRAPGEVCPDHGIVCHYSYSKPTYSYTDVRSNIITSADLFAARIVRHPFKLETHRLGSENSEDALTWNVFRSLQEASCLHELASWIIGRQIPYEPWLYLWGILVTEDSFEPWDLLVAARKRFESNLPVDRPLTEPDIALHLPGRYLILIEAKFTSPNPYYTDGPRKNAQSLTKTEVIDIYQDPRLEILDAERARESKRIYYQLWRNTIFAEWMARQDHHETEAYHANLTREGFEKESCEHFRTILRPECSDRFVHIHWEGVLKLAELQPTALSKLRWYLQTKTAGLVKAFRI
jgi:Restriction Endonuclease associating with ARP